ncbi:MAG TPA: SCP2 sterol-binding domain-containing protein [Chroococcales cyanobacterium]
MSIFADTEQLYQVMQELWTQIKADKSMSDSLLKSKLVVRFHYREPDGHLTIDGSDGKEIKVTIGACDLKPDVEMFMKSDVAHNFWCGKENPAAALLTGKIVSKGPVNKALALLPAIKPAFQIYPTIVENAKKLA